MADVEQDAEKLARQKIHTTVYCQCFSPCGKYLATGDNFGRIAIFSLSKALGAEANEEVWKPVYKFKAHSGAVYCLVNADRLLISGGVGDIQAWVWNDIITKAAKCTWSLKIPIVNRFDNPETNSLVLKSTEEGSTLFAGCGDNKVHLWDIESGQQKTSLEGHSDYVHSVVLKSNGQECISASEDGSVRIWDIRTSDTVHIIEPWKNEECARPQFGKWVGCVAVDPGDDWLVCGGGPQLSLWHLRSLNSTSVFDGGLTQHQHVMFYEDSIISGGTQPFVTHWAVNGDLKSKVPCTPTSVYSVAINNKAESTKVLSVAGSNHKIDICTNFGYRAFSMSVY